MPVELTAYITEYGYLALFSLVFLQEIGVPNPVPNEIILLFSGYLASIGALSLPLVLLTVISADFIGTTILYAIFYFFGAWFFDHKPRWIPISREKIEKLAQKFSTEEGWGIYVGRLIPYLRGYISVGAGLFRVHPRPFLTAVFISAVTWSGGYAIAGKLLGPYWEKVADRVGGIGTIVFLIVLAIGFVVLGKYLMKRSLAHKKEKISHD